MNSEEKYIREQLQEKFDQFDVPFQSSHWEEMKSRMEGHGFAPLDGSVSKRWIGMVCLFGIMAIAAPFFIDSQGSQVGQIEKNSEPTLLAENHNTISIEDETSSNDDHQSSHHVASLSSSIDKSSVKVNGQIEGATTGSISADSSQRIASKPGSVGAALESGSSSLTVAINKETASYPAYRSQVNQVETEGVSKHSNELKVVDRLATIAPTRINLNTNKVKKTPRTRNHQVDVKLKKGNKPGSDYKEKTKRSREEEESFSEKFNGALASTYSSIKKAVREKGPIGLNHTFGHSILLNVWDNPSFTGIEDRNNLNLVADRRWLGLYKSNESTLSDIKDRDFFISPFSASLGYDGSLGKRKVISLGLYARNKQFQLSSSTELGFTLARRWVIGDGQYVQLGSGIGYNSSQLRTDNFALGDMISARDGFVYETQDQKITTRQNSLRVPVGVWYGNGSFFGSVHVEERFALGVEGEKGKSDINPDKVNLMVGQRMKVNSYWSVVMQGFADYQYGTANFTPAIFSEYKQKVMIGASYQHLQVVNIHGALLLSNHWRLTMTVGTATADYLKEYGQVSYLQSGLRYQFGRQKSSEN